MILKIPWYRAVYKNIIIINLFGPSKTFIWPQQEDKCCGNLYFILKILDSPATATG